MRVLIVTHFLGESFSHGVERVVAQLSVSLRRGGVDVAIATTLDARPTGELGAWPRLTVDGLPVYAISAGELDSLGVADLQRSVSAIDRVLDAWAPDVVHVTLLHGIHPAVVSHLKRRGVAVVLDFHSFEAGCAELQLFTTNGEPCAGPDGGRECATNCFAAVPDALARVQSRLRAMREALNAADAVVACSSFLADWLRRECGAPEPRVISSPIEPPAPAPMWPPRMPAQRGRLRLVTIGPVTRAKGADLVVEAVSGAGLGPTELLMLGPVLDGELRASMRRLAAGVDRFDLRLFGAFDPDALGLLLSDVDALVVASRMPETYSQVARQAWSRGIPVIASRLGALGGAVRDGVNGLTFAAGDAVALADALRRLVDEPDLLTTLGAGALRERYLTADQHRAWFEALYAEIAPDSVGGPRPATMIASTAPAPAAAEVRPSTGSVHGAVFADIYRRELWRQGGESSSGPGSRRTATVALRRQLPELLRRLAVATMLDVGCGDYNWMREVELGLDLYIGLDVVFDVVLENRLRYGGPRRRFLLRDLIRDPLPRAELVLCRDVLIHFPDEDLIRAMRAIIDTGARFLLASTFVDRAHNPPIALGDWRPLNMQLPPLSLPAPRDWMIETPPETGYDDKRLALWDLHELA